jgi:hypothetical protein
MKGGSHLNLSLSYEIGANNNDVIIFWSTFVTCNCLSLNNYLTKGLTIFFQLKFVNSSLYINGIYLQRTILHQSSFQLTWNHEVHIWVRYKHLLVQYVIIMMMVMVFVSCKMFFHGNINVLGVVFTCPQNWNKSFN